jgi:protein phosphatase
MRGIFETSAGAVAFSSKGKVRRVNEDRASVDGRLLEEEIDSAYPLGTGDHLLLVADGMGGHARGDLASSLAIEFINSQKQNMRRPDDCIDVLRHANERIYNSMLEDTARRGMGSTIVGAIVTDNLIIWFNVGDSRAYLYRDGELRQLSIDHVPSGATGQRGRRTHEITQSLGGTYQLVNIWPAVGSITRRPGDCLLLCSDGLTDLVDNGDLSDRLGVQPITAVARSLVELALERGAPDNVTAIVAVL